MKIIDLTQTISSGMPVYPGTETPVITDTNTIDNDGFAEKLLSFYSHTGTHIDAPAHILKGRFSLDKFSAGKFMGKGIVIDVTNCPEGVIEKEHLEKHSKEIEESDFILFRTDWDKRWGSESYFSDFPTLSTDSAKWLCCYKIKGIGFDCISADPVEATDLPIHKIILNNDLIIIENLCNLDKLTGCSFIFSCLPLKIENSDGSPVRAVGITDI